MKQIEKLFNRTFKKEYDTPKRLNRSNTRIPLEVIEEIEGGNFTHESLKTLGAKVPIFIYKTCITIHGNFPEISTTRIHGYKNVIQNENGSLEIRYSAIDTAKMERINKALRHVKSPYKMTSDSQGHTIEKAIPVTKETYKEIQAQITPELTAMSTSNIYGHYGSYLGEIWGQYYLVVYITPVTIPEAEMTNFIAMLTNVAPNQVPAIFQEIEAQEQQEELNRQERIKQAEAKAKEREAMLQPYIDAIAALPKCNNPLQGTLIRATTTPEQKPCYMVIKVRQSDRFKRFYISQARAMTIEEAKAGSLQFVDKKNLFTVKDFVSKDYRLFA